MSYLTHYKALAQLALPIMVGQLGMLLVGFADTIMIGHHSTQELAAASFVNNLLTLAIVTGIGFSLGLTPVVGALQGQKRHAEAGLALKSSLSFLDIDIAQNADDIFNCGDLISRFLSDRRRWNDSNTSSRFLHLNQNRYR